jgi:invasion protein IalB
MNGERAFLDINDGRSVPARIVVTSATNAAAASGELFVPVQIEVPPGVLTEEDIGKAARLRLSRSPFGASFPVPEES